VSKPLDWSLIAAVNDEKVLNHTLLRSPVVDERCQVIANRGFSSASQAYNAGILEATNEILILAHQDVYLPPSWLACLSQALGQLSDTDPHWGVLGVYGITRDFQRKGYLYSTGLKRILGGPFGDPIEVASLDEVVLVVRKSADLLFDAGLPGFHLYGTDLCMKAHQRGMRSYVIPAFCIHNSNGLTHLPKAFWKSYFYLRRKWWDHLPLHTPCTVITRGYWPVVESVLRDLKCMLLRSSNVGMRCLDPHRLYHQVRLLSRKSAEGGNNLSI